MERATPAKPGVFYGLYWWIKQMNGRDIAYANGHGGQYLFLDRATNLLVVITADTKNFTEDFIATDIMENFIVPAVSP